jgi:hypothetical protein
MGCFIGIVMTVISGIFGSCDRDFFPENDIACDGNYGKYKSVAIGVIILTSHETKHTDHFCTHYLEK